MSAAEKHTLKEELEENKSIGIIPAEEDGKETTRTRGTTKSNGRKEKNDKFYTNPEVAKLCLSLLNLDEYTIKIEPSAGSGSFSNLVEGCVAYDIEPEAENITQQDWLEYKRTRNHEEKVLVFGNPPFGIQNNLAIKFINHSSQFADTIAFILPRSFRKESIINKLNPHLFLREEILLPKNAFLLQGENYDLPAVFQVWDYNPTETRTVEPKEAPEGYRFVKKDEEPDFSIQRVGGKAGTATVEWKEKNPESNNFISVISAKDPIKHLHLVTNVVQRINEHNFEGRDDAVGPRSIPKSEFIRVLNTIIRYSRQE